MRNIAVLAAALALFAVAPAMAQTRPTEAAAAPTAPDEPGRNERAPQTSPRGEAAQEAKLSDRDIATAPIREIARSTRHSVTVDGRAIPYTATAGTLTIRDDDGKPRASMFYVAYVADRPKGAPQRPVTFFYNGGPGSASMWLHMGSFAPMRIHTASPDPTPAAPFVIAPNNESLIDKTDMVFLDAIGAGFSRPLGDAKGKDFWGVDQDADAFARAIMRYLTVADRWNSPKFLFGESYGTTRSAALAYALQDNDVQLNGVLLLSSILNYGIRTPGFDRIYVNYLPSYAAAAWYHHRLANPPVDLGPFLAEVRAWANGPYAAVLAKGTDAPQAEIDAVAHQMSLYTGLSEAFIKEADLRVDLGRFRKELLRDQRRTIGRYDSRFTGIDVDAAGEDPEFDPSDTGVQGAFVAAFHDYLQNELDFTTDLSYRPGYDVIGREWDWRHKAPGARFPQPVADVAQDLGATMRKNPHLKVYSLNGLYDMATPFFGTEYDLGHMQLDPSLRGNVRFAYYPSGHMVYLNPDALKTMKADVARFYDDVLSGR
ncbi:MAG TPA: peptidase S10 [Caulobacteraceae bacterium]|nr:peptidase S10 [Caulobacteraceae bacterium]